MLQMEVLFAKLVAAIATTVPQMGSASAIHRTATLVTIISLAQRHAWHVIPIAYTATPMERANAIQVIVRPDMCMWRLQHHAVHALPTAHFV